MANRHVDAVIVGAGAGGGAVAKELSEGGLSVVVLERGGWPPLAATIGAAVLFAAYRVVLAPASWAVFLNVLLAGILLGLLTRRTRSLHVTIGARLGWALTIGTVFSFPAGGSYVEGILNSVPVPGLALDRAYGPEGSWLALLLLGLGIVISQVVERRRRSA